MAKLRRPLKKESCDGSQQASKQARLENVEDDMMNIDDLQAELSLGKDASWTHVRQLMGATFRWRRHWIETTEPVAVEVKFPCLDSTKRYM